MRESGRLLATMQSDLEDTHLGVLSKAAVLLTLTCYAC